MSYRSILLGLALIAFFPCAVIAAEASPKMVTLTLPAGDAREGRAAFQALSCTTCHRVSGESGFPSPVSANPGPTLGRYHAQQEPARLAMSIFAPSHEITATVRENLEDHISPMPDFTRVMTVRQFMDVIAYIRSLDEKK